MDTDTGAGDLMAAMKEAGGKRVEKVELFDVFSGAQTGAGKKSVAYAITMRSPEGTMRDEEVDAVMKKILKVLEKDFWRAASPIMRLVQKQGMLYNYNILSGEKIAGKVMGDPVRLGRPRWISGFSAGSAFCRRRGAIVIIPKRRRAHYVKGAGHGKTKTVVSIGGKEYTICGTDSVEYIHRVALHVNKKLTELKRPTPTSIIFSLQCLPPLISRTSI